MTWKNLLAPVTPINTGIYSQKLLKQSDQIFVMDNHRAALWCWLQLADQNKVYDILHIDRHYDSINMFKSPDVTKSIDKSLNGRNIHDLSIDDYLTIKAKFGNSCIAPIFSYDNYFPTLLHFYGSMVRRIYMATHKSGLKLDYNNLQSIHPDQLPMNIDYWMEDNNDRKNPWIVNIDIDYFFYPDCDENSNELFSVNYIEDLCIHIKKYLDSGIIHSITIATSPGNTGSEYKANNFCEMICELLGRPIGL